MSKKIIASLLSFLLAITLVLPTSVMATEDKVQLTEARSEVLSKLNFDQSNIDLSKLATKFNEQKAGERKASDSLSNTIEADQSLNSNVSQSELQALTPQNYVPISDSNDEITVIVELQEQPIKVYEASQKNLKSKSIDPQKQRVDMEQRTFKADAQQNLNAKFDRQYKNVFNGFALKIKANQVEQLLALSGVKAVYPNRTFYATADLSGSEVAPMMERSAPYIGSPTFWDIGVEGEGVKVGVLDTGITKNHPDLQGAVPTGVYWGYDYINDDSDPTETTYKDYLKAKEQDPTLLEINEKGDTYYTSHGTHVSGTIAGQEVGVAGHKGVRGIAPKASVYAFKVLGPYGSGTSVSVMDGIEGAVTAGMNVINLSLGSPDNQEDAADSVALNNAMLAGVIAVVSSGNSGPNDATVGSPGAAELPITVGASKPPLLTPIMKVLDMNNEEFYLDNFDKSAGIENLTNEYELVDVGLGKVSDYEGKKLAGKIAFIKRGELNFSEKAANAINSGAIGAIVYNNVPGALEAVTLGDSEITIPMYTLSGVYGDKIKKQLDAGDSIKVSFSTTIEADIMGGFSSRGPAYPSFSIKPDIAAPGIGIVSTMSEKEGWYKAENGTSMAAPHIAGAAALLVEKFPNLDQYEIKSLMMNNTVKLVDRNKNRYSHMDQGAGRIALDKILDAKAVAKVEDTTQLVKDEVDTTFYTGNMSFGYISAGKTAEHKVIVKDIIGQASQYDIEFNWYGNDIPVTTVLQKDQVQVSANGEVSFTLSATVGSSAVANNRYEGEIVLTEASGHVIQIPVALYVGKAPETSSVSGLKVTPYIFSPNQDKILDTSNLTFNINKPLGYFSLDVHLLDEEKTWIGTIAEAAPINPGGYSLKGWNGTVGNNEKLQDGPYLMQPRVGSSISDAEPFEKQRVPFIIDTKAPVSTLDEPGIIVNKANSSGVISGQVTEEMLVDLLVAPDGAKMSDVITIVAWYDDGKGGEALLGTIDDQGHYAVSVPVGIGDNQFEIYVIDMVGNGVMIPAHIVDYKLTNLVAPVVDQDKIEPNQDFTLDVAFSVGEAVYSAKFDLLVSSALTNVTVSPSKELSEHQELHNSDIALSVSDSVYEVDEKLNRIEYRVSLQDAPGYRGEGSLATFHFEQVPYGDYSLIVSNLVLLDKDGNQINVDLSPSVTVKAIFPSMLKVDQSYLSLLEGETKPISVSYSGVDGKVLDVTESAAYAVTDKAIVEVVGGQVTAKKVGSTVVTVTYGEQSFEVQVKVAAEPTLEVNPATLAIDVNNTSKLTANYRGADGTVTDVTYTAEYTADVANVVAISKGEVTGKQAGTTVVTVTYNGVSDKVNVTVNQVTSNNSGFYFPATPSSAYDEVVKKEINAKEATVITLKNGLTITIPVNAINVEGVYSVEVRIAKDANTQELLKSLKLGSEMKPFGTYFDIVILDKNGKELKGGVLKLPVEVSIGVEKLGIGSLNAEKLNLYKIEEGSKLTLLAGRTKDGKVNVKVDSFSRYMFMAKDASFTDVTKAKYPWAIQAIETLAAKNMLNGMSSTLYAPDGQVTRAEFVSMLVRALGLKANPAKKVAFSDVAAGSWYYDAVQAAVAAGIVQGYKDNTFAPDAKITRAEMAAIVSRALISLGQAKVTDEALNKFADQGQIQAWAREAAAQVTQLGIMNGRGADRFAANELTTRAEAAVVIYRLFNAFMK